MLSQELLTTLQGEISTNPNESLIFDLDHLQTLLFCQKFVEAFIHVDNVGANTICGKYGIDYSHFELLSQIKS